MMDMFVSKQLDNVEDLTLKETLIKHHDRLNGVESNQKLLPELFNDRRFHHS